MAIDFTTAVNAYKAAAKAASTGGPAKSESAGSDPGSFAGLVNDSLKSAVSTGYQAETLSLKQIAGEADLKDVITAVANAEQTLETVVAVRDKVLNAYNEILKMPI